MYGPTRFEVKRMGGELLESRGPKEEHQRPIASSIKDTLPETNMETQKRHQKDYSPSKRGLYGFPC